MRVDLTPRQVEFVEAAMRDYIDVSTDRNVLRDARAVVKRLQIAKQESRKKR